MTTLPRIIQLGPLSGSASADPRLAEQYDVLQLWKHENRASTLAQHGKGVQMLVTSGSIGCDADTIEALPDLKAICSWGVGYETLDVAAAARRNIQVSNTPDVLTDCVADLAWGLMIASARKIGAGERYVRSGQWGQIHGAFPLGSQVSGKRLGIVGLGRIGEAIAKRGIGFDMQVQYHNRRKRTDVPYPYAATLLDLAHWADFLIVATVGGSSTRHLISRDVLLALGDKGTVVNISRGPVIDEQALVELLGSGKLGAAALDVFEHEPVVPDELTHSDRAVVLPHIGSATVETRQAMEDLLVRNIETFFASGKLISPVA